MLLKMNSFSGVYPRINEQQLPIGGAVAASGFRTDSSCIEPYKATGPPLSTVSGCKTFIVWPTSEDRTWPPGNDDAYLSWDKHIDYCHGVAQGFDRIIYTGDLFPKMGNPSVSPFVPVKLGMCNPGSAPHAIDGVASLVINPLPGGSGMIYEAIFTATPHIYETDFTEEEISAGASGLTTVSYCYTYVDSFGQESKPSPSSAIYDVSSFIIGQGISVGFSTDADPTDNAIAAIRVYRCSAGSDSSADFFFIGEVQTGNVFDDYDFTKNTFRQGQDALQTEEWDVPPLDLIGLTSLAGGILSGYIKNTNQLCFSEPFVQYAWPEKYRITMPQPILHIESLGEEIVVFMASLIMTVRGEPGMMSVSNVYGGKGTPCLTRRGFVKMEAGLLFPGHEGLYLYNGSSCSNITESSMNILQWKSLLPDKFISIFYDGRYWAFREAGEKAISIDIHNASLIEIDLGIMAPVSGAVVDYHGRFFVLSGDKAYPWSEGLTVIEAAWMSGVQTLSAPVNFAAALISSESPTTENAIRLEIWSHYNGVKTLVFDSLSVGHEVDIPLNKPFRLPSGFQTEKIQVRLKTKVTIREIRFSTSMTELSG